MSQKKRLTRNNLFGCLLVILSLLVCTNVGAFGATLYAEVGSANTWDLDLIYKYSSGNQSNSTYYKTLAVQVTVDGQQYQGYCLDPTLDFGGGNNYQADCHKITEDEAPYMYYVFKNKNSFSNQGVFITALRFAGYADGKASVVSSKHVTTWFNETARNGFKMCSNCSYYSKDKYIVDDALNFLRNAKLDGSSKNNDKDNNKDNEQNKDEENKGAGKITFEADGASCSEMKYKVTTEGKVSDVEFICKKGCSVIASKTKWNSDGKSGYVTVKPVQKDGVCDNTMEIEMKYNDGTKPTSEGDGTLAICNVNSNIQSIVFSSDFAYEDEGNNDNNNNNNNNSGLKNSYVYKTSFNAECLKDCDNEECCNPGMDMEVPQDLNINNCCRDDTESWVRQNDLENMFCDSKRLKVSGYVIRCNTGHGELSDPYAKDFLTNSQSSGAKEYCDMYCSERVHVTTPGNITSTSGRYFKLSKFDVTNTWANNHGITISTTPFVEGVRRCRIIIKYDKWEDAYYQIVTQQKDEYNKYQKYAAYYYALTEATKKPTGSPSDYNGQPYKEYQNQDHTRKYNRKDPDMYCSCSSYPCGTDYWGNPRYCSATPPFYSKKASWNSSDCQEKDEYYEDYTTPAQWQRFQYYQLRVKDGNNEERNKAQERYLGFYFSASTGAGSTLANAIQVNVDEHFIDYDSAASVASCVENGYQRDVDQSRRSCEAASTAESTCTMSDNNITTADDIQRQSGHRYAGNLDGLCAAIERSNCSYMGTSAIISILNDLMTSARSKYIDLVDKAKEKEKYLDICDKYFDPRDKVTYQGENAFDDLKEDYTSASHYDTSKVKLMFSYEQIFNDEYGEASLASTNIDLIGVFAEDNSATADSTAKYSCKVSAYNLKHDAGSDNILVENDNDVYDDNYSDIYSKYANEDEGGSEKIAISDVFESDSLQLCFHTETNKTYGDGGDWWVYRAGINGTTANKEYTMNNGYASDCFKKFVKRQSGDNGTYKADRKFTTDGAFNAICNWKEKDITHFTLIPGGMVQTMSSETTNIWETIDANAVKHHYEYKVKLSTFEGSYETFWQLYGFGHKGRLDKYFAENDRLTCANDVLAANQSGIVDHTAGGHCKEGKCTYYAPLTCFLKVKDKIVTIGYCPADGDYEVPVWDVDQCSKPYNDPYNFKFKIVEADNMFPTAESANEMPRDERYGAYGFNWYHGVGDDLRKTLAADAEQVFAPDNIRFTVVLTGSDIKTIKDYNVTRNLDGGYGDFELRCDCDPKGKYDDLCIYCESDFLTHLDQHTVNGVTLSYANQAVKSNLDILRFQGRGTDPNKWKGKVASDYDEESW